jgi:hypothetical protein
VLYDLTHYPTVDLWNTVLFVLYTLTTALFNVSVTLTAAGVTVWPEVYTLYFITAYSCPYSNRCLTCAAALIQLKLVPRCMSCNRLLTQQYAYDLRVLLCVCVQCSSVVTSGITDAVLMNLHCSPCAVIR